MRRGHARSFEIDVFFLTTHISPNCQWPRGVTVSTLDSESSDRGSNPREAFKIGSKSADWQAWHCIAGPPSPPNTTTHKQGNTAHRQIRPKTARAGTPRTSGQNGTKAKRTQKQQNPQKANSKRNRSGAQSPAFQSVRPKIREAPPTQKGQKTHPKSKAKNTHPPQKQVQPERPGTVQTPAFQRVRPKMRRSPGTRTARKRKQK